MHVNYILEKIPPESNCIWFSTFPCILLLWIQVIRSLFKFLPGLLCITPYLFFEKLLQMKYYLLEPLHSQKLNRKNTCKQHSGICQKGNNLVSKTCLILSLFLRLCQLIWNCISSDSNGKKQRPIGIPDSEVLSLLFFYMAISKDGESHATTGYWGRTTFQQFWKVGVWFEGLLWSFWYNFVLKRRCGFPFSPWKLLPWFWWRKCFNSLCWRGNYNP